MPTYNSDVASITYELPSYTLPLLKADQDIVAGAVDYNHRPALRHKHGRWLSASFIIWVEIAERIAYFGISGNLINFLTGKLGESTAMAASQINAWSGVSCLLPILGGLIADSFLGKYYTIVASSLIYILGLGLLTLSTMLHSHGCDNLETDEDSTPGCSVELQTITFFMALYLVAIGQGGHKPCVQAFGADQFNGEDPAESKAKSSFFNWWYFGVCLGIMLGVAVMSYVQDNFSWVLGFGIPCIIMTISLLIFLLGTMTYRYTTKGEGENPCKRIGKVFVSSARNWNASVGDYSGSRQFKFLDKALVSCDPASVEDAKTVLKLFPIWATNLVFAIVYSQISTLFTKQAMTLDRSIGNNFVLPAAAVQIYTALCIVIFIPIYDRVIVPIARKCTGNPAGLSMLQRVGSGLFIALLSMVVAAVIEAIRLETAKQHGLVDCPDVTIPMSIWWLVPQYVLFGISEGFALVGLQEFFYDQVPNELRSVGLSLYLSIIGIGGLLSSLLVSIINKVTSARGESWFSDNLNRAHIDYFYWLLAGLGVIALSLFVYYAKSYTYSKRKG